MFDWFGRTNPIAVPEPTEHGPFEQYPFFVVRNTKRHAIVFTLEQFKELYPNATAGELSNIQSAFFFGGVRGIRIVPAR